MYLFSQEVAAFILMITAVYRGNRFLRNVVLYFWNAILNTELLCFSEILEHVYQIAKRHILENRNIK